MSSFTKVRSGISGLKKQREELAKNYDFLTQELHRMTDDNTAQIRTLVGKAEEFGAGISGIREHLNKTDESVDNVSTSLGSEITGIQKRLDNQKKTLGLIGQRLQQATDAATEAARGISDSRKFEKDVSRSLQDLSAGVTSVDEKVSSVDASSKNAIGAVDKKFTVGMEMVKKLAEGQSGVIKQHDSALERVMLLLQSLKKDIVAENERIANVKETAKSTEKKLELLGVLESKIKHIEDVKAGLVRGVESIKSIKSDMAVLRQKNRDLESRLSNADKFLESRLLEKTKGLDGQIAEKTAVMEGQMQERLKFLESNLTEKGRTLETKLSADLTAMNKSLSRELAEIKILRAKIDRNDSGIKELKGDAASFRKGHDDNKSDIMLLWEKVNAYRDIAGRVAEIEKAKEAIMGGMERMDKLSEDVKMLSVKEKNFEAKTSGDITSIRSGLKKTGNDMTGVGRRISGLDKELGLMKESARAFESKVGSDVASMDTAVRKSVSDVTGINLTLTSLKKDLASATQMISNIKTDHASTKRRMQAIGNIKNRLANSEKLVSGLSTRIDEIRSLDKKIAALSKDLKAVKASMDRADYAIDEKIKFNVDAIKKDSAFNSAALARLDEELKRFSLDINSLKKDIKSESAGTGKLQSAVNALQKKVADLEKLQIKLGDMEQTKQALTDAMETKLEDRIKFFEATLKQKADNIEAGFAGDINEIKKQLSSKDKSIDGIKTRLEKMGKIEEKLSMVDKEKEVITRNISSLQNLNTALTKANEKQKNMERQLGELRTEVSAGLTELRGKADATKSEEGNKFSTAVKAFLNTKADLNKKMSILDLKISENEKRFNDFAKVVTRLDMVERKLDRLNEKGAEVRRDVDTLERRGSSEEKIMVVDLAKDGNEIEGV